MTCDIGYRTTFLYECLCKMANREEKLRNVAMVAKFLDDNKLKTSLKKWILTDSNFIMSNGGEIFLGWMRKCRKRKRKCLCCVVFTNSIKWAHEISKFHVAVVQRRLRSVLLIKSIAFLPFSLPSPSSLLKLSIVAIQKFCYDGIATSNFCLLQVSTYRCVIKSVLCFCIVFSV